MPPRRFVRGHPARCNVEPQEQELPNAPEVQPQGEVTNTEFPVTNQVGQQRGAHQEEDDTSRIRKFLRMNPISFTGSSTTEDLGQAKKIADWMLLPHHAWLFILP
ncbi:hypothetical protein H5410_062079 [Solanum commersonii]|uniref:Uncharacterized protein n=1 Tax=Solanum commersonii TaxID=4109 RepID=A0A9J5W9Q4_SOLCO|nr:hypothetical protein H5410_062079 [Solanum commersonii]